MKTRFGLSFLTVVFLTRLSFGAGLSEELKNTPVETLKAAIQKQGDATRGAIVFHQPYAACTKCHRVDGPANGLGPSLTKFETNPTDAHLIEAVLYPSKSLRKGYESVTLALGSGKTLNGVLVKKDDNEIQLRDLAVDGKLITVPMADVEVFRQNKQSAMPDGLADQLISRQQFYDLVKYLMEIRDGGQARAEELQPPPALYTLKIPEYEKQIDHAGILKDLDRKAFSRGEAIYQRLCINCHGTKDRPGSLPTSLRFAEGKFKNGPDPFTMYQTLTRGFGLMVPQAWMVPQQKYDVIHYIREAYLKPHNPDQFFAITPGYLDGLPKGNSRGPEPRDIRPWVTMNYGQSLMNTYEVGKSGENFAYKGIAVRLDAGAGGVSRGNAWMVFDHDTFRVSAAWTGEGFIDWNGIHFNGRHQIHPRIVGDVQFQNPNGPGWAHPETDSFEDTGRVKGRDGKFYGPLPSSWAKYHGLYQYGDQRVISYSVGGTEILEMPGLVNRPEQSPVFTRSFEIGPRDSERTLLVATTEGNVLTMNAVENVVQTTSDQPPAPQSKQIEFDGASYAEVKAGQDFDFTSKDFNITARVKTKKGGTILAKTVADGEWVPDGKSFFIRRGRLCFDIGWVGAVQSDRQIADGRWHDVAMRWHHESGLAELFIDGQPAGQKVLRPKAPTRNHVVRIGYTSPNFPGPQTYFNGQLKDVRFIQAALTDKQIKEGRSASEHLIADWSLAELAENQTVTDQSTPARSARWKSQGQTTSDGTLVAGLVEPVPGAKWERRGLRLCLKLPAGTGPLRFTVWVTNQTGGANEFAAAVFPKRLAKPNLKQFTKGGPRKWTQTLTTQPTLGNDQDPFAVDTLTMPENNPWLAQMRLSGIDFYPEGDRTVITTWDGDAWLLTGLNGLDQPNPKLTWQRIADGMFQPLGVKIVADKIHITCRDQLVILHDFNGDGETDFYECLNHDHQVTEHFHEFAMGLQTDDAGNFYYAKSARHALKAVVPHHGTLLKVSADGSSTEILATGFRAANGVCLNPDGTFVVTDQEGHWNPKNRINWVRPGGFYGNMFGYHDVTDSSDDAMQQPLCWITNKFDRSPAELLWVPENTWGSLAGSLLNLSYGYGKVFVVPFEEIDGQKQGGMCELPVGSLPTGLIRGRFHPKDRQLYACGLFAWAGSATKPGGLYRIRHTEKPMVLPKGLKTKPGELEIEWTDPISPETAADQFKITTWDLKRTASYGSKHYNEKTLEVTSVSISKNGKTLRLQVPKLEPTWGMEIRCRLTLPNGQTQTRIIHNSIFRVGS